MKLIRGIRHLPKELSQCVLTMGNFDGIHLGHQQLIQQLKTVGQQMQLPTVAMIFEPQPLEFFKLDKAPARLTAFHEKFFYLKQLGVDYLLCVPFNQKIAALSAQNFIEDWLIEKLKIQALVVGDDFQFGHDREGSSQLLTQYSKSAHFTLYCQPTYMIDGLRVSSTSIRNALSNDDLAVAEKLLGRPYSLSGRVVHGQKLARELGYPTVNIALHREKAALQGIYLTKVFDRDSGDHYFGAANIGMRPTVNGKKFVLEVNLFDFDDNIYGHHLEVIFLEKIRDEERFASLDMLKQQIAQDVCIAKQISAKF